MALRQPIYVEMTVLSGECGIAVSISICVEPSQTHGLTGHIDNSEFWVERLRLTFLSGKEEY